MDSAPCDGSGGGQWDEWSTGFGPYHLQAFCGPHLRADIQVRKKKKPTPLGQYSLYLQPGCKATGMHLLLSGKLIPPFSNGKRDGGGDMQLGQGDITSQCQCQWCWGVKLLSGSGKLGEETPVFYLLDEASAGGLKRPCAPRMGSDLTPRGSVVRLSCLCTSASPLLCHGSSWRLQPLLRSRAASPQSWQHPILALLSPRSIVDLLRRDGVNAFSCSRCRSSWAREKHKMRKGSFLLLVGWDVMVVLSHLRGATDGHWYCPTVTELDLY